MSSKRRTKIEIVNDILKAMQNKGGRIKPTHLLYKSNLSHKKMMEYVEELMNNGMMTEEVLKGGNKMYHITQKGFDYLAQYKQIREFSNAFGIN
jgi:predicted transcriptional regulator